MSVREKPQAGARALRDQFVFLSGSIPDPSRWDGEFDAYEITDAVVAVAKAVLAASGRIVCAAHPTIAPLLVTVARDFPPDEEYPPVVVYQSRLFEDRIPAEVDELTTPGTGRLTWTKAAPGESPDENREKSLKTMRARMLEETEPAAAVFVGGMGGISDEFEMFRERFPDRPVYPLGNPGGEARSLLEKADSPLRKELAESDVYPTLMRKVVEDLARHLES